MTNSLTQQIAEALYNLEPLITGYGDRERKLSWPEAVMEGYGQKYIQRSQAVTPLILDAVSAEVSKLGVPGTEDGQYEFGRNIAIQETLAAIAKLKADQEATQWPG
ncbi:MAG: hypothetical protein L0G87_00325 [Renibacterium salmoninarum]|nr:hypothetical protein [Renibacterium salmoninarum]